MSIQKNINNIKKTMDSSVKIVAVTKNRSTDEVSQAINAGITDIGENRLQEAEDKLCDIPKNITKHFIGRLQTNKVRDVVSIFDVIQSVDSLKLAKKINQESNKIGTIMPILIQVNTSGEDQKGGVELDEIMPLVKQIYKFENLKIEGLMTIAINSDDQNKVQACFKKLKSIFNNIKQKNIPNVQMKWISMGMSGDYKIAIEEGANMVRIGSKIFSNSKSQAQNSK